MLALPNQDPILRTAEREINLASASNPPPIVAFCKIPKEVKITAKEAPGYSH
jgi:hypothetical protein